MDLGCLCSLQAMIVIERRGEIYHQRTSYPSILVVSRQWRVNVGLLPILLVSERDELSVLATWSW